MDLIAPGLGAEVADLGSRGVDPSQRIRVSAAGAAFL